MIETYFQRLQNAVNNCLVAETSQITCDKRGTFEGFFTAEICFVDNSVLHVREFVDTENGIDRLMYTYQYMTEVKTLIFRYDNTGHHRKAELPTYPHHKHEGTETNVLPSSAPVLEDVLHEIERMVRI